mmetsp:Transcript_35538/g.78853  ORF Transcript_35538/g.78853 Transcript_35538/m.78853 type:complete len:207 (-) Transcript_35538:674-1294(-)
MTLKPETRSAPSTWPVGQVHVQQVCDPKPAYRLITLGGTMPINTSHTADVPHTACRATVLDLARSASLGHPHASAAEHSTVHKSTSSWTMVPTETNLLPYAALCPEPVARLAATLPADAPPASVCWVSGQGGLHQEQCAQEQGDHDELSDKDSRRLEAPEGDDVNPQPALDTRPDDGTRHQTCKGQPSCFTDVHFLVLFQCVDGVC